MSKKRVLITGISGLLGSNLGCCWQESWDILGLYNTHPVTLKGISVKQIDLLDVRVLEQAVVDFKPELIVHCAALANVDLCEENHVLAERMNITATGHVARVALEHGSKLLHISTDTVYDGIRGNYSETDQVNPVNYYAQTKLEAEALVLKDTKALIARTSFYGVNVQAKQCLAEWVIAELSQGRRIKGFTDVISSNIFTNDLAGLLKAAVVKDLKGVYNVACQDALSKYDFVVELAQQMGLDASLIDPVSVDTYPFKARRSKNLSLNVTRLIQDLGAAPPDSRASIRHFKTHHC